LVENLRETPIFGGKDHDDHGVLKNVRQTWWRGEIGGDPS